jgi:hypothetical protein
MKGECGENDQFDKLGSSYGPNELDALFYVRRVIRTFSAFVFFAAFLQ